MTGFSLTAEEGLCSQNVLLSLTYYVNCSRISHLKDIPLPKVGHADLWVSPYIDITCEYVGGTSS